MAEYIERKILLDELSESARHHANNSREESLLFRDRTIVREQPTADVVEREKIDKAINEMERYSTSFEYVNRHDLADAVDYCIGVIQRNIGEE